ncbi:MAG: CubicO group peptidase (beta-lactamase class C family) [Chlamydiales bacterium]|jgi:CubicO group peptidase (beta-lactamase class C family)
MKKSTLCVLASLTVLSISQARGSRELSVDEAVAQLKTFVEGEAKAERFSGTVLFARDGEVLFQGAYGLASRRFDVPNRIDTKFNLGSMNKMFTCVAIMQLAESRQLTIKDPIYKYLDETWLPLELARKISIEHLMTHTSGLGSYFNETYMQSSRAMFRELDDYKPIVYQDTLAFEPGTRWSYSNTGMFLLGVIVQLISDQNYFDYVREHIFEPAGMLNTDSYEMDRPVKNLAIGYSEHDGEWFNNLYAHVIKGGPAGGGFSTVPDLLAFDQALRNLVLLDQEHTELTWSAKPDIGSPSYGFGFFQDGNENGRIVGHGGGFSGISSNLDMFLDSGFTAAVMSNIDGGANPVKDYIRTLLQQVE